MRLPFKPGDLVRRKGGCAVMTLDRIVSGVGQVSWNTPTGKIGCARIALSDLAHHRAVADQTQH